jgi:glycosyltransferase involved in cell wall biosynthesis
MDPMTPQSGPSVSIILPCFNEAPEIVSASFKSIVEQSCQEFECLVVDESSDPVKAEVVRDLCAVDPRFTYVRPDSRIGLAGSLNLGISRSNGNFIARFDADDLCVAKRLEWQMGFLIDHPEVGVVGGAMEIIDESGTTTAYRGYPLVHEGICAKMMWTNAMAHPTVMFRREVLEVNGGYDPNIGAEDLELWLRWMKRGVKFANLPQALVMYRQGSTVRSRVNWSGNLRARCRHFSRKYLMRRLFGICAIAIWANIPASFQEWLYRSLILRSRRR